MPPLHKAFLLSHRLVVNKTGEWCFKIFTTISTGVCCATAKKEAQCNPKQHCILLSRLKFTEGTALLFLFSFTGTLEIHVRTKSPSCDNTGQPIVRQTWWDTDSDTHKSHFPVEGLRKWKGSDLGYPSSPLSTVCSLHHHWPGSVRKHSCSCPSSLMLTFVHIPLHKEKHNTNTAYRRFTAGTLEGSLYLNWHTVTCETHILGSEEVRGGSWKLRLYHKFC